MIEYCSKAKEFATIFFLFNPTNLSFLLSFNAVSWVNLVPNPTAMMALQWFQVGGYTTYTTPLSQTASL